MGFLSEIQRRWPIAKNVINYRVPEPVINKNSVTIGGTDVFLHTLIVGPTGCGKTSTLLIPLANQVLDAYERNNRVGMTIIEPKGDFARAIYYAAKARGIPVQIVDPMLPEESVSFNPFVGADQEVAEMVRTVLSRMFGDQEAFFKMIQESTSKNFVLFVKRMYKEKADFMQVLHLMRNTEALGAAIKRYEELFGEDNLSEGLRTEALEDDNFLRFTKGLRTQIEDFLSNDMLRTLLTGKNTIDFERHLADGGIIVVNTEMGRLKKLGDMFGTFLMMCFQNAVFTRPGEPDERRHHYLIVDELGRYINPDLARFLELARSYRVAGVFALQSLGQLIVRDEPGFQRNVLTNLRNKIAFGGLAYEDAAQFSKEFGQEKKVVETRSYQTILGMKHFKAERVTQTEEYVPRYTPTQLMELPKFHFVHKLILDDQPMPPGMAKGKWINLPKPIVPLETNSQSDPQEVPNSSIELVPPDTTREVAAAVEPKNTTDTLPQMPDDQLQPEFAREWFVLRKVKKESKRNASTSGNAQK